MANNEKLSVSIVDVTTEIPVQQYPSSDTKQHVLTRTDGTYRKPSHITFNYQAFTLLLLHYSTVQGITQ